MWLYQLADRKKMVVYSTYLLFVSLGCLSVWRSLHGFSLDEVAFLFAPVCYALLVVTGILLLIQEVYRAFLYIWHMVSVLLITSIFVELHAGLLWTEEMIGAYVYLVAVSTLIALFLFEKEEKVVRAVELAILCSLLLSLVILVSQIITPLFSSMIIILMIGQVISYMVSMIYLPIISPLKQRRKTFRLLSVSKLTPFQKRREKKSSTFFYLKLSLLFYLMIIISSWYYITYESSQIWNIGVMWLFSLFIVAALYNSLSSSILLHLLLPSVGMAFVAVSMYSNAEVLPELMMGLIMYWIIGLHQLLIWIYSKYSYKKAYGLSSICFFGALLPLMIGGMTIAIFFWTTVLLAVGYIIVNMLSLVYIPVLDQLLFVQKKRADRPFKSTLHLDIVTEDKNNNDLSVIDIEERERDLTIKYGKWLSKKEMHLK